MLDNLKARIKRMGKAWTENNDGKTLPSEMDALEHSGAGDGEELDDAALDAAILEAEEKVETLKAKRENTGRHVHKWIAGLLPNGDKIRSCVGKLADGVDCGVFEKVEE